MKTLSEVGLAAALNAGYVASTADGTDPGNAVLETEAGNAVPSTSYYNNYISCSCNYL